MMKLKNNKGITLVILIITIVVMLILAGTSITIVLDDGLTRKADKTANENILAEEKELVEIAWIKLYQTESSITYSKLITELGSEWSDGGAYIESPNENKFTVTEDGNVEVIEE